MSTPSRTELGVALVGALAASVGDLAMLWVGWAADGRFGFAPPPAHALVVGHYLGVFGIPWYAVGYRAVGAGLVDAAPRAARIVARLGAVGSVVGAVVHGVTGVLAHVAGRVGDPPAPEALAALPEAAFLLPLWLVVGAALVVGSLVFTVVVGRGGTRFPRGLALASPLVAGSMIACATLPMPRVAAFAVPAAPNLAHVVFFAAALLAVRR